MHILKTCLLMHLYTPFFLVYGRATQDGSLYLPCPTSVCFTYILHTTDLPELLPPPQLVIVLIKGAVTGVPLRWFPW